MCVCFEGAYEDHLRVGLIAPSLLQVVVVPVRWEMRDNLDNCCCVLCFVITNPPTQIMPGAGECDSPPDMHHHDGGVMDLAWLAFSPPLYLVVSTLRRGCRWVACC